MSGPTDEATANLPGIPEFYSEQSILITGGSGFMGKVLIEKLLRSCVGIEKIFLLLRTKKGKDPSSRLQDITSLPLFDRLKEEKPWKLSKLVAVAGDVMELDLGLTQEDRQILEREVSVVFHVAATVRFNEPLQDAVFMNVRGTLQVLQLATSMRKLKVFLHVSTTFCHTERAVLDEQIYPSPADWKKTIHIAEQFDRDLLSAITPKYLGNQPNTYTFTKALAEHVVKHYATQIPVVIFRPSIVVSSIDEPRPGWTDNFNGPIGFLAGISKGVVRVVLAGHDVMLDTMPVDVAIKTMIIAASRRGVDVNAPPEPAVYNCAQSGLKQFTLGQMCQIGMSIGEDFPAQNSVLLPSVCITRSKIRFYFVTFLAHFLPALVVDTILRVMGRKQLLLKLSKRIMETNLAIGYFLTNEWKFNNTNYMSLREGLQIQDREAFYFSYETFEVYDYLKNAMAGVQKWLFKDIDDLPRAKAHQYRMKVLTRVFRLVAICALIWILKLSSLPGYVSRTGGAVYRTIINANARISSQ